MSGTRCFSFSVFALTLAAACTPSKRVPPSTVRSPSNEGSPSATSVVAPVANSATITLIRSARVFDGESVVDATDVLVRDETIAEMGKDLTAPAHAKVVDARGMTLLPGLIESHCHVWSPEQLRQAAVFGVTTELSMTGDPPNVRALRQQHANGKLVDAADLLSAGHPFAVPGGHGTEYGFDIPTIEQPRQAEEFIRTRVKEGSDYIKFMVDDGSIWGSHLAVPSESLLNAGVAAAHQAGKLAVVHAGSLEDTWRAVRAGADGLAHVWSGGPQPELIAAIAEKGMFVIPTLSVQYPARGQGRGHDLLEDPEVLPYLPQENLLHADWHLAVYEDMKPLRQSVAALYARKVPILVGTDAAGEYGVEHGASVHGELRLLAEAGLSPLAVLRGATSLPAQRFGLRDRGRIAPGLVADLLLVRGDPTNDIRVTTAIVAVWRKGMPIDRESYRARLAAAVKKTLPPALRQILGDFETTDAHFPFGERWKDWTDQIRGGKSSVSLKVIPGGAASSKHALLVSGVVVEGRPSKWSGAIYSPSHVPWQPTDLSSWKEIVFWAKGDGARYMVMLHFPGGGVRGQFFVAKPEWTQYRFDFRKFGGTLATDVTGIFFGTGAVGSYSLQIDQVELRSKDH